MGNRRERPDLRVGRSAARVPLAGSCSCPTAVPHFAASCSCSTGISPLAAGATVAASCSGSTYCSLSQWFCAEDLFQQPLAAAPPLSLSEAVARGSPCGCVQETETTDRRSLSLPGLQVCVHGAPCVCVCVCPRPFRDCFIVFQVRSDVKFLFPFLQEA